MKTDAGKTEAAFSFATMGAECALVLASLHDLAFRGGEVWDEASMAALLSSPGTEALLVLSEQEPVGFILSRTVLDETEILTLAVAPAFRRRGVGRALVQRVQGKGTVFLEVAVCNRNAIALYGKCGFVKAGLRRGYYRDGSDALVLISSSV